MSASPARVRRLALARWESGLMYRNGEQILLAFVIPVVLLIALQWWRPTDDPLAVVLTASIIATAFTSLAISIGFERRSGALRFLATTPLTRSDLLVGKCLAQGGLALLSSLVVLGVGVVLGAQLPFWPSVVVLPFGAVAFAAWGFWLAGAFRAEAVLALANALFILLLIFGGVVVAADQMPGGVIVQWLPSALLADGLRAADATGVLIAVGGLALWAVVGVFLARRNFRWD
jgi:ABC-2 type transport system permease protein